MTMARFPINTRIKVNSNEHYDFYIMHCDREWYVEAFPIGTLDHTRKTMAGFSTLKVAKECIESWKGWLKPRGGHQLTLSCPGGRRVHNLFTIISAFPY